MTSDFDLAIVGSGFAGSLMAVIARRLGLSVVLIERGRHPRFAIGESSTPLAALVLETLADRYALPWLRPFSKWGTWQATYPEIGAGLKRGFSFFHHTKGMPWEFRPGRENQLLVAASPNDSIADTHWHRPDFDLFLQRQAVEAGAEYTDETRINTLTRDPEGWELSGDRPGGPFRCRARWIVDASGPRGFLFRQLGLRDDGFRGFPPTAGIWNHFTGVQRWESLHPGFDAAPFPPDDAAQHHVFEGGWMWVLRLNNGLTSAGFALHGDLATGIGAGAPEDRWRERMDRFPSVAAQFSRAQPIRPFTVQTRLPFRSQACTGPGWIQLPMAAGFIDPLFSSGFVLNLLGIERLGDWISGGMNPAELEGYEVETLGDLDATADLIAAAYRVLDDPPAFQSVAMLYFAAASFSETARRLGRPEMAPGFLLRHESRFGPAFRECLLAAGRAPAGDLADRVASTVKDFNVAGLCDVQKRGWYPVAVADLFASSDRLGVSTEAIAAMLQRNGFDL
jgi:FADH2 O2-dependent halogenase